MLPFHSWPMRMSLVLILSVFLFCARLGERAFWSEEVRWAEIPREMILNDHYLQPTINGKIYYDKPLASYWLVVAASWLTGTLDETSVRLPCALSGILGVVLIMLIARRLYGDDAAILAGIILATSYSYIFFARNASADMENVAGILAALWIFLRYERQTPGWWVVWLWLVMAFTSLTKGLLGFVLPALILGVYSTMKPGAGERLTPRSWFERNRWLFNGWTLLAVPLACFIYLSPFLLSASATGSTEGLEMVYRENLRRFVDPVNHRGPIYLYLYVIFLLLAPWSLLLPAAWVQAHGDGSRQRFALSYFWTTFVFFTLSASRRSYYLLPILPAAALLIAPLLTQPRAALRRLTQGLLVGGFVLLTLCVALSIVVLLPAASLLPPPWDTLPALPQPWLFALAWVGSMSALGVAVWRGEIARAFVVVASAFAMLWYLFFLPATDHYRTQKPFAEAVKERLGPVVADVALYRNREIVFYLGQDRPLTEYLSPAELRAGSARWLIVRRQDWDKLELPAKIILEEPTYPWEGRDQIAGKLLLAEIER